MKRTRSPSPLPISESKQVSGSRFAEAFSKRHKTMDTKQTRSSKSDVGNLTPKHSDSDKMSASTLDPSPVRSRGTINAFNPMPDTNDSTATTPEMKPIYWINYGSILPWSETKKGSGFTNDPNLIRLAQIFTGHVRLHTKPWRVTDSATLGLKQEPSIKRQDGGTVELKTGNWVTHKLYNALMETRDLLAEKEGFETMYPQAATKADEEAIRRAADRITAQQEHETTLKRMKVQERERAEQRVRYNAAGGVKINSTNARQEKEMSPLLYNKDAEWELLEAMRQDREKGLATGIGKREWQGLELKLSKEELERQAKEQEAIFQMLNRDAKLEKAKKEREEDLWDIEEDQATNLEDSQKSAVPATSGEGSEMGEKEREAMFDRERKQAAKHQWKVTKKAGDNENKNATKP